MTRSTLTRLLVLLAAISTHGVIAETAAGGNKRLLWGDTHLHTNLSPDSYMNRNFSIDPESAYRFARGLPVVHPTTRTRVQLETPLDFLVVSDHAESMGVFKRLNEEGVPRDDLGLLDSGKAWIAEKIMRYLMRDPDSITTLLKFSTAATTDVVEAAKSPADLPIPNSDLIQRDAWQFTTAVADANNLPGEFSAIIGWEWSSIPAGANLHRVVFTNSNGEVARQYQPFASSTSNYPEDLWAWLAQTSEATGADFVAIPHNSNISRGFMFPTEYRLRGTAIDKEWVEARARWETVVEATQVKGDSETDPALSPNDEFADFESFPYYLKPDVADYQPEAGDFVRSALRTGLAIEQQLGSNPYRFGVIGSTDSHTGLATAEEPNFWGKMATDSIPEDKATDSVHIPKIGWLMSASGLAAVYAEDNTRQAILDAFKRREVYATTGPRIGVQVYAGSGFIPGDENQDMANISAMGVPMGGELFSLDSAPSFLVRASKDPKSAHLDRIQVIKGWHDDGKTYEKVYDIAWSGDRQAGADGKVPAVPDTVNPVTGTYSNEHGATHLATVWTDPDFSPVQPAFYYVRVLEVPTPRHSALDAIALGIDVAETGQPVSLQERAYTSPIFYTP